MVSPPIVQAVHPRFGPGLGRQRPQRHPERVPGPRMLTAGCDGPVRAFASLSAEAAISALI
jgi:hypothetical protein